MINRDRLAERLSYNAETGEFIWRARPDIAVDFNATYPGRVAGQVRKGGAREITVDGKRYSAHRLAWLYMTGDWPRHSVGHRDGDQDNNRFSNLCRTSHGKKRTAGSHK